VHDLARYSQLSTKSNRWWVSDLTLGYKLDTDGTMEVLRMPSYGSLVTLKMEVIYSSENSILLTIITSRHIPEQNILKWQLLHQFQQQLLIPCNRICSYFSPTKRYVVRFEVFTAVTMKNGVFWVVTTCGSCKNRRFGGTWRLLTRATWRNNPEDTILQKVRLLLSLSY
jgi:hypothetical protein